MYKQSHPLLDSIATKFNSDWSLFQTTHHLKNYAFYSRYKDSKLSERNRVSGISVDAEKYLVHVFIRELVMKAHL